MWDYVCPKCRKEVPKKTSKCPHCHEKYGVPLKVPLHILRNLGTLEGKKELEEYVHKHVFPRISQFQRDYLTQFFTVIFSNSFEEGNLSAWTTQWAFGTGVTFTASQDVAYDGKWSGKAAGPKTNGDYAYTVKTFTAGSAYYTRFYINFNTLLNQNANRWLGGFANNAKGEWLGVVVRNESTSKWGVRNDPGATAYMESGTTTVTAGVWYCVELYEKISTSAGALTLWVNGVQKVTQTNLNTTADQISESV
jgi:hypothetical protein